jgi:UDP-glucose 4-epimerase
MKVIVTGGCGFIGSHLTHALIHKGFEVIVIDNLSNGRIENLNDFKNSPLLKIVIEDISEQGSYEHHFKNCDIVFHLAALADIVPSIEKPDEYFKSNVIGTFNIIEASRKNNVKKIVYAASSSSYGLAKKIPTPETAPISPQYPYAFTKYQAEQTILHWGKVYNISVVSLRLFNVFGPRSRTTGTYGAVFGVFLAQKLANEPLTIVGDGSQKRDFTYVTDIVEAFYSAAISNLNHEVINIGTGNPQSINYLAKLIQGKKIYIKKRPGEPDCTCASIEKAQRILGWKPKISFEEGVKLMLKNIEWWREAPVWTPKKIEDATKKWFDLLE